MILISDASLQFAPAAQAPLWHPMILELSIPHFRENCAPADVKGESSTGAWLSSGPITPRTQYRDLSTPYTSVEQGVTRLAQNSATP